MQSATSSDSDALLACTKRQVNKPELGDLLHLAAKSWQQGYAGGAVTEMRRTLEMRPAVPLAHNWPAEKSEKNHV